ncbi:MAG: PDZ domain-containing protein [Deltaproteobacteria bacterium]|nr:PDZ domain-containing protein [Deltaproteobacteria bacterium]
MRRTQVLSFALLSVAGCATTGPRFELGSVDREKAARQYVGRDFVLGASTYVSDFFGEKDRLFADPRPFEIIELYHESGKKIAIGLPSETIVPAGTNVRVKQIIFPLDPLQATFKTQGSELLPTAHPWVVVERTDEAQSRTPMVLALPRSIANLEQLQVAFQERLKSQQWVTTWLTQRDPLVLDKIFRKEVAAAMTWVDVLAAMGEPKNLRDKSNEPLEFTADYGDLQVLLVGNVVKETRSLKAEAAAAAQKAQVAAEAARVEAEKRRAEEDARRAAAEEARQKADEEAQRARAEVMAKAEAERQAELARQEGEKKKLAADEDKLRKEAELKARKDAAIRAKEEAAADKERRLQEAALAKQVAEAEAEALAERRKAEAESARAEADAVAARKRFQKQLASVEAEAQRARKKAEAAEAEAAKLRDKAGAHRQEIDRLTGENEGGRRIGAKVQPVSAQLAGALGLPNANGAFVSEVAADGEAARAGLKANDIVLAVEGQEVVDPKSFVELVAATDRSKAAKLEVLRASKKVALKLEAAATAGRIDKEKQALAKVDRELEAKEKAALAFRTDAEAKARAVAKAKSDFIRAAGAEKRRLGVRVEALSEQLVLALGLPEKGGAYVAEVKPDTDAAKAGLEKNDVVVRVNGVPVASPEEFSDLVGNTLPFETVDLELFRKGKRLTVAVAGDSKATITVEAKAAPSAAPATTPQPVRGGRVAPDPRKVDLTDASGEGAGDSGRKPVK